MSGGGCSSGGIEGRDRALPFASRGASVYGHGAKPRGCNDVNAPLDLRMDQATFLDWIQSQPRRCELVGGRVVMQQGGTRGFPRGS